MKSTVFAAALALLTASVGLAKPLTKKVSGFQNTVYWTNWYVFGLGIDNNAV